MPRSRTNKDSTTLEAYCPHCFLLIESDVQEDWPPEPVRCPHCRLLIGEGRAKDTPDANPGARGTAAGVFAHRAKRGDTDAASAGGGLRGDPHRRARAGLAARAAAHGRLPAARLDGSVAARSCPTSSPPSAAGSAPGARPPPPPDGEPPPPRDTMPARWRYSLFLPPFVLLGVGVIFVAFSGGPGRRARRT